MAPDINTLTSPSSNNHVRTPNRSQQRQQQQHAQAHANAHPHPQSATASRRTSQMMGPPNAPASATRSPMHPTNQEHGSGGAAGAPGGGVPLRHPRPLTAAELYLECEKEQEAVVNRLTRELTALRAQSASVASNASYSSTSTSASLLPVDITDPNPTHQILGATHPTPSRRHRSSSSYSARSIPTSVTSMSAMSNSTGHLSTQVQAGSTSAVQLGNISQASAARAAAATGGTTTGGSLSRQPSVSAASGTSTPARQSLDMARHGTGGVSGGGSIFTLPHRPSLSRDPSFALQTNTTPTNPTSSTNPSPAAQTANQSVQAAMQHYADTAAYRTEMEIVKAENDVLRQRVRALEHALRAQRRNSNHSDAPTSGATHSARAPRNRDSLEAMRAIMTSPSTGAGGGGGPAAGITSVAAWADGGVGGVAGPRERSESQSTTASSRRATGIAGEDDVRVGESASNVGLGRTF